MDQFQVLMMQAVVLTMQKVAGSAAEAGSALRPLLWGNPDVLLLYCIATWETGRSRPLAYLSEIYNLCMFLDTSNKKERKPFCVFLDCPLVLLFGCK